MRKVGEHYFDGDYVPDYYELLRLTETINAIITKRLCKLLSLK